MAFDSSKIKANAEKFSGDSMAVAASSLDGASEEEVRKKVVKVVKEMLDALPTVITWFIGEEWAGKLTAKLVEVFGDTLTDWLR